MSKRPIFSDVKKKKASEIKFQNRRDSQILSQEVDRYFSCKFESDLNAYFK